MRNRHTILLHALMNTLYEIGNYRKRHDVLSLSSVQPPALGGRRALMTVASRPPRIEHYFEQDRLVVDRSCPTPNLMEGTVSLEDL